jgi:TRAP-type C4-dicarboxylate transport system permease small subunit
MKKAKKIINILMLTMVLVFGLSSVAMASNCPGVTGFDSSKPISQDCSTDAKIINEKIYKFAGMIAGVVLGVAVIVIVYAGFKYATSQGDPKVTEQAKMQIVSAGVGIGIAMLAFVILNIFKAVVS